MRLLLLSSVLALSLACNQTPQTAQPATTGAQQGLQAPAAQVPGAAGNSLAAPGTTPGNAPANAVAPPSTAAPAGATPAPVAEAAPPKPPEPTLMPMDVPAGTTLAVTLETAVSSDGSQLEDTVHGTVTTPVVVSGMTVIPAGAPVTGTVVAAEKSGRVKGLATVAIRFNRVVVAKTPYTINTARITRTAETTKGEDAKKVGIATGVGTAIGAIAGGGKGAAIGAGVGGGAGAGAVMATRGKEISIPVGTKLKTTIEDTVRITAPM